MLTPIIFAYYISTSPNRNGILRASIIVDNSVMTNYDNTLGLITFVFCPRTNDSAIFPFISAALRSWTFFCNINSLRCLYCCNPTSQGKNSKRCS